jgi:hypothetical protein
LLVCHFGGVVGIERRGRERVCVYVRYWRNCWSERHVVGNELLL